MSTTTSTPHPRATDQPVRHPWVPAVGALAGTILTAKAGLIIGSQNSVGDGPMAVLYLTGILIGIVAAVGLGLRRQRPVMRVVVAVLATLLFLGWITAFGEVVEPLVAWFSEARYVQEEAPIGLLGLVVLVASYAGFRRDVRTAG